MLLYIVLFNLDLFVSALIVCNLLFQGIGNSVATWQPCHLVLSGLYLYTYESEKSLDYQRYLWYALFFIIFFHVPSFSIFSSSHVFF